MLAIVIYGLLLFPVTALWGNGNHKRIKLEDMREWLAYLASDQLEGRATFSEGLGLAAAYIAEQLKAIGVKPAGDNGSYFQQVRVLGVRSTPYSTLTIETGGRSRTFKDGEGIRLLRNVGGKRSFTTHEVEFLGYGLNVPGLGHNDYAGRDVKGKVVVWLGPRGPKAMDQSYRRLLSGRARYAIEERSAIASIGARPVQGPGAGARGQGAAGASSRSAFGGPQIPPADFTTVQRLDRPIPPVVSAQDEFFEFLLSAQEIRYAELKDKADRQETLPIFSLRDVKITFNLDASYEVVRTQFTRNVAGIVEGRDPKLKDSYVAFGAHYDHVGYSEGEITETSDGRRRAEPKGRIKEGELEDRIWNGADDDGSGSVTILAVAKAFALGPKPRRSLIFVWHSGEERGLFGSRYFADYPTVALDRTVAQINMDMVGRNRDDRQDQANTVYAVGADRISTELHNLTIDANTALARPLEIDFELNDPAELESFYYRSDHYSYAAKGIPIVFFTTGLHPDYHANTDSAEKINYDKMVRIGQLAYELGARVANLDHPPSRDHLGARTGKGSSGKLQPQ
jgi:hypothetical protein